MDQQWILQAAVPCLSNIALYSARNGNLEMPVYFLKAKLEYTFRNMAHVDTLQISGGRKNTALNVFKI
jgi:hypothetical protein